MTILERIEAADREHRQAHGDRCGVTREKTVTSACVAIHRAWAATHPAEWRAERTRASYWKRPDQYRSRARDRATQNAESISVRQRDYYERTVEAQRAKAREYYANHREERLAYQRQYQHGKGAG